MICFVMDFVITQLNFQFVMMGFFFNFYYLMEQDDSTCLGIKLLPKVATEITFSDVYGVEFINYGLICGSNCPHIKKHFLGRESYDSEVCSHLFQ